MSSAYRDINLRSEVESLMDPESPPAVIDFWAPWCGPCKAMAPHFEAVAQAHEASAIDFYKLNTEAHPELAQPFHVRSIPTTILVLHGEIADVIVGAVDQGRLEKKVQWLLHKASRKNWFDRLTGR